MGAGIAGGAPPSGLGAGIVAGRSGGAAGVSTDARVAGDEACARPSRAAQLPTWVAIIASAAAATTSRAARAASARWRSPAGSTASDRCSAGTALGWRSSITESRIGSRGGAGSVVGSIVSVGSTVSSVGPVVVTADDSLADDRIAGTGPVVGGLSFSPLGGVGSRTAT